jgi:endonuclease G
LTVTIPIRVHIEVGAPCTADTHPTPALRPTAKGPADVPSDQEQVEEGRKEDYSDRKGYDEDFLGGGRKVPLPDVLDDGDVLRFTVDGNKEKVLRYQHFSVVMSKARRMCHYSAVNIDGAHSRKVARGGWRMDPRIGREQQIIHECYGNPPKFSRGHMTRREDPVWGTPGDAKEGNDDSMHVTNVTPQMQSFNAPIWLGLEDYALGHARDDGMRLCVFTGPMFEKGDPTMHEVRIPRSFWKVIAFVHDKTKKLCATGYRISQADELPGQEFVFGEFDALTGPAQVSLSEIERDANISFGALTALDPKGRTPEGVESTRASRAALRSFADIVFV